MHVELLDLRDQRGRAARLATAFVVAIALGVIASRVSSTIPAGPYDRPVAREWFILATGMFAWLLSFLGALAIQNDRARRRWHAARARLLS